jgi:SpoIVB peptidase S55
MPLARLRRFSLLLVAFVLISCVPIHADDTAAIFPLKDVKPGMKGEVYTIFEGDTIEKIDLVVLGVIENALGPKQDIILVQLLGEKVEHTGVVAGMSGSPVYFEGRLAGALSLKIGVFNKEAIGGVTPIANMLGVIDSPQAAPESIRSASTNAGAMQFPGRVPVPQTLAMQTGQAVQASQATQTSVGGGEFLVPIETPLIATGVYPETMAQFSKQLAGWGMSMVAGGTAAPSPDDARLKPGDMVGVELIRGDLTITPGCTVTVVEASGKVLACGHPIFSFGSISMPMARGHVITTLASAMASTKIMSTGGTIGTMTDDRVTAIGGQLGAEPPMIPVEVSLVTPTEEKKFHFEMIESPQLTPTLVALATYNGIVGSTAYGEGFTLQLDGEIQIKDHTAVLLNDLFAPSDMPVPTGFFVASTVQSDFSRIYSNPYEVPHVTGIHIRVKAVPERRSATIENAWIDKNELVPGETVSVKVQLRPYRGASFIQEIPVTIPAQAARGNLQLVISDAETVNRTVEAAAASSQGQLSGLEELIKLMNRDRENNRLYATLLQPTATLLVEDKIMPNAPTSEISVMNQRQNNGAVRVSNQSTAGEWSVEMHQVISGERTLSVVVK